MVKHGIIDKIYYILPYSTQFFTMNHEIKEKPWYML